MIATVFAFDHLSGLIKTRYLLNDVSEVSSVTNITKLVVKWYKWRLKFRVFSTGAFCTYNKQCTLASFVSAMSSVPDVGVIWIFCLLDLDKNASQLPLEDLWRYRTQAEHEKHLKQATKCSLFHRYEKEYQDNLKHVKLHMLKCTKT